MNNLPWFRYYSEALHDGKIARAAHLTGQPKALVIGVWTTLLCLANNSPQRGCLKMSDTFWYDEQDLAAETGIEAPALRQLLQVFQDLNMVAPTAGGYALPNWEKRQRPQSMSTERVRRHRQRQADGRDEETGSSDAASDEPFAEPAVETTAPPPETDMKRPETGVKRAGNNRKRRGNARKRVRNSPEKEKEIEKEKDQEGAGVISARGDPAHPRAALIETLCQVARAGLFDQQTVDTADSLLAMGATPDQVLQFGNWWSEHADDGKPWLKNLVSFWDDFVSGRPPHFVTSKKGQPAAGREHLGGSW